MDNFKSTDFTILMVDDTPKNLQVLGNTLKNENYKLEFATNGLRAIEWLDKKTFDLILLDVMMPEMSGFEVCEHIRKDKKNDDLPIIFLTAKTDKESIVKGFELGAQDYVTKPFDTKELLARVKTQLELKYNKEKLKSMNKILEQKVAERTAELNESNIKLDKANQELKNLDFTKNEFLRMISHEIRTPLNGILGPLDLLKDKIDSEELMPLVSILDKSVATLEEYSKKALRITEIKSDKVKNNKLEINLKELLEFCVIELSNKFKEKNIELNIDYSDDIIKIYGDYDNLLDYFKITLSNLLLNYSKEGELNISYAYKDERVKIFLKCSKIKSSLTKLSELFGITKVKEDIDHHPGIDIYLSKLILASHNGNISINESDGIKTFEISFTSV